MAKIKTFIENKEKFKTSNISDIKTPRAAAIIWNYKYRLGSKTGIDPSSQKAFDNIMDIQKRIILTKSIRSIETQKSKGTSEGKFSMILAPTKNWCAELTLGSWICIMMTPKRKITRADLDRANPNLIKFIGIIDTVSCDVSVNQAGHRTTTYKIEGPDWSACFNDVVYVDPAFRTWPVEQSPMSQLSFLRSKQLGGGGLTQADFTTENNIKMVSHVWMSTPIYDDKNNIEGSIEDKSRKSQLDQIPGVYALGTNIFSIPKEVVTFMGWQPKPGKFQEIAKHVEFKMGKINKDGEYDNQKGWPYKIMKIWNPSNIFGNFTAWQLYKGVNAEHIEELFNDLYFCADTSNDVNHQPFNFKMPSINDKFSLGNFNLNTSFANSLNDVPLLNNNQPNAKVSKKLRFTLFNRIMPFYIRDPENAERFYKEGSETAKISIKYIDPITKQLTDKKTNNSVITKEYKDSRTNFNKEILSTFASMYCNVPKTEIRLNDILGVSYYVSSKNRINLLEIVLGESIIAEEEIKGYVNVLKNRTQEWEHPNLFSRDGLRNAIFTVNHFPVSEEHLANAARKANIPPPTEKSKIKIPGKEPLEVGFKAKQIQKEAEDEIKKLEQKLKYGQTWEEFLANSESSIPNVSMEKKK